MSRISTPATIEAAPVASRPLLQAVSNGLQIAGLLVDWIHTSGR
jgi:hypothetical protein